MITALRAISVCSELKTAKNIPDIATVYMLLTSMSFYHGQVFPSRELSVCKDVQSGVCDKLFLLSSQCVVLDTRKFTMNLIAFKTKCRPVGAMVKVLVFFWSSERCVVLPRCRYVFNCNQQYFLISNSTWSAFKDFPSCGRSRRGQSKVTTASNGLTLNYELQSISIACWTPQPLPTVTPYLR